jgi:hypothetical protein
MGWLGQVDPTSAMAVMTAMITPAVLISACGLLLLSTTSRVSRVFDRVRSLPQRLEELERRKNETALYDERRTLIFDLVATLTRRARLLQWSQTLFYLGVATFVTTSIGIGVVALGWMRHAWINVALSLAGGLMLLAASVFLILESRIALHMTQRELAFLNRLGDHYAQRPAPPASRVERETRVELQPARRPASRP